MGIADSPLKDHVIFIEGAPRSGTTRLATLLATHPEIAGVGVESQLFDFGVDRMFDNFEHRDPHRHGLTRYIDREELVDLVRNLCDGVLLAMRSHVSASATPEFVVEKTPVAGGTEGLNLARKRECYPDAWYLHIVRDREAVTRSLMRAPWMPDRSHAACARLWDSTIGHARATLGDLPRYREVSYEELHADPAEGCMALFEWLGVGTSGEALEAIRALSREQFSDVGAVSDMGAVAPARARSTRSAVAAAPRRLLAKMVPRAPTEAPGSGVAFLMVRALFHRDAETLRSLTAPSFEFVCRSPDGDLSLRDEDGRAALERVAEEAFTRRYVSEWWASAGVGPGEWWTSAAGTPFSTIFFSAVGGDATRMDMAIGLVLEGDLIRRAVVVSAGALTGRPIATQHVAAGDSNCDSST